MRQKFLRSSFRRLAARRNRKTVAGVIGLALVAAAGCTVSSISALAPRETWREAEEKACIARGALKPSAFVTQIAEIKGEGICGVSYPLQISALNDGSIAVKATATLGCPAAEAIQGWFAASVQPAAIAYFGAPVVEIRQLSNYACRKPMGYRPGKLSEHSYGNALDVAEFKLANGRTITVLRGWRGPREEQAFLREIAATACERFKTFLGPGVAFHSNHFHLDLAHRGDDGTERFCKPAPQVVPPTRTPVGNVTVAARPTGKLLTEMPPDVAEGLADPFGASDLQKKTVGAAPM